MPAVAPASVMRKRSGRHRTASEHLPVGVAPAVAPVIPTKSEAANLPWVLNRIPRLVGEVILVDGLSHDRTPDVAQLIRPDAVIVRKRRWRRANDPQ